jgi:hypothetical protein
VVDKSLELYCGRTQIPESHLRFAGVHRLFATLIGNMAVGYVVLLRIGPVPEKQLW